MDLLKIVKVGNETAEVWQYGKDDYVIYYHNADCSVRGTLKEIQEEYEEFMKEVE